MSKKEEHPRIKTLTLQQARAEIMRLWELESLTKEMAEAIIGSENHIAHCVYCLADSGKEHFENCIVLKAEQYLKGERE